MKKTTCSHSQTSNENQQRSFEGEIFKYKSLVCQDCGASLWDVQVEEKFNAWLDKLYDQNSKRNKFQIQFQISVTALKCLDQVLNRFPGVERSYLMRALIAVYTDVILPHADFSAYLEDIEKSPELLSFTNDESAKFKLQFKPRAIMDLRAFSEMLEEKPGRVVEDILHRMISLFVQRDPEIKKFWEELVFKNLEIILKAA